MNTTGGEKREKRKRAAEKIQAQVKGSEKEWRLPKHGEGKEVGPV